MGNLKQVTLPEGPTPELVELLGAHWGDGSLFLDKKRKDYTWRIFGNLNKDEAYLDYLFGLIQKTFFITPKKSYWKDKNSLEIRVRSKLILYYLHEIVGLPLGKKNFTEKNKLFFDESGYSTHFIRGVFDTDGCVVIQKNGKYRYKLIKIANKDYNLLDYLKSTLLCLGFHPFITKGDSRSYQLVIRRKIEIPKWVGIIGSKNPRNIKKLNE